jgi:hypothetical protein
VFHFHDRIAQDAWLHRETSLVFRRAAQGNANKTWFWLVVGGATWYLAGCMWALIPFAFATIRAIWSISSTLVAQRLEKLEAAEQTPARE